MESQQFQQKSYRLISNIEHMEMTFSSKYFNDIPLTNNYFIYREDKRN